MENKKVYIGILDAGINVVGIVNEEKKVMEKAYAIHLQQVPQMDANGQPVKGANGQPVMLPRVLYSPLLLPVFHRKNGDEMVGGLNIEYSKFLDTNFHNIEDFNQGEALKISYLKLIGEYEEPVDAAPDPIEEAEFEKVEENKEDVKEGIIQI